jgi:hypothetical protein
MRVIGAPFAVHPDNDPNVLTELQPDVLVTRLRLGDSLDRVSGRGTG